MVEIVIKPTESFTTANTTQKVDLESGGFVTDDDDYSLSSEEADKVHDLPVTTGSLHCLLIIESSNNNGSLPPVADGTFLFLLLLLGHLVPGDMYSLLPVH